jgi:acylglycerol lipase
LQTYSSAVETRSDVSTLGGVQRFVHSWVPTSIKPWAALTLVHGFGDHGGRFDGMATSLASVGVCVQAVDLVGHGRSPGRRGCIDSYEHLLDEVVASVAYAQEAFPKLPQFLLGHSMGGNLVLNLALRRPEAMHSTRGLIATSPMLRASEMPKERIMDAGRWLATKIPNWRINAPLAVLKLSQDRRAQDAYMRDRWVHRKMSLRLAASLVDTGLWAIENAHRLQSNVLLMHGSDDQLTCPSASKSFAQSSNGFASFKLWHGCRHDLHDDLQRERVYDYLVRWMKQQCVVSFKFQRPASVLQAS